ncbi:mitochondrial fission factor homolog A isoform X3 [Astyanax mexicanus]|uniref:mitochondrial fission factor homolog A isoform X3 n=1 Tax=Astyanax mexicanus TaxID=7994 RepID=UPI000BBD56A5|nr:mitochondrial fission factor homolog A isoform X3 [Astyanax mexicanus]
MSEVDMAEMNRIQYELEYTEGISQQMRIPDRLKIGSNSSEDHAGILLEETHSTMMHVPERIVVAGDSSDPRFGRPVDLDLIQSTPVESVELKAPPRVLTLKEQPLQFLEPEQPTGPPTQVQSHVRSRRERCASEASAVRHNGQINKFEGTALVTLEASLENTAEDASLVDAASLRRQIIKLNRRLQLLEQENKERAKREMIMYSLTVAFWLANTWIWLRR